MIMETKTATAREESGADWATEFRKRAARSRTPISAVLELTRRCNLRCRHCYLGNQAGQHRHLARERDAAAVKRSITEWADAGVLFLLITGGDPMIRPDFPDIYRHARELGMLVSVFCDGLLVTEDILNVFHELPPRLVEISIYGATAATYEKVTRVRGSYARAWEGIRRLHSRGITLGLKTVVLTINQHELDAMESQARSLNVGFRYDSAVFPCLSNHQPGVDAGEDPVDLRIDPRTAVAIDTATEERRQRWRERIERTAAMPEVPSLYNCGAGLTGFSVDPYGNLSPCLLAAHYRYAPEGRTFLQLWNDELGHLRARRKTQKVSSFSGRLRGACAHCPAMNHLETGDEQQESPYMREVAFLRYQKVMHQKVSGDYHE